MLLAKQAKGKLTVQLYDHPLTKDLNDCTGKVVLRNSLKLDYLVLDVVPLVGDVQGETIKSVMRRMVNAAISRGAEVV